MLKNFIHINSDWSKAHLFSTDILSDDLQKEWDDECANARGMSRQPKLFSAILRTFKRELIKYAVIRFILELGFKYV